MLVMTTVYNVDSASGILGDMSTGNVSRTLARGAAMLTPTVP
jgi:hypothetical protein